MCYDCQGNLESQTEEKLLLIKVVKWNDSYWSDGGYHIHGIPQQSSVMCLLQSLVLCPQIVQSYHGYSLGLL